MGGKATFLLHLADSVVRRLEETGIPALNLHRHPTRAYLIENPNQLPPTWRGLYYIQNLRLCATPDKAVYAESNRLRAESTYLLSYTLEGILFTPQAGHSIQMTGTPPAGEWYPQLLTDIVQKVLQTK